MRYQRLFGTMFLTAAFLALPAMEAWGQKEKKKEGPKTAEATDSSKIPAGEYVGVLKTTPGSDRTFTVELETTKLVATGKGGGGAGGGVQNILKMQIQLQQAEAQAMTARTPQARQQAMGRVRQTSMQLQRAIAQLQGGGKGAPAGYTYAKSKVTVEYQASEKARVRTMLLPETFDEKGNLKKYTKAELDELKGKDKSAVGYESALEKLEVGQKVKVVTAAVAKATPTESDKDKDKDDAALAEKSKQAKLIVVLAAADPALVKGPAKKKK